jgi:hypothetical protein
MNPSMTLSLVLDHLTESRQRAAADRQAGHARGTHRKAGSHTARRHWLRNA